MRIEALSAPSGACPRGRRRLSRRRALRAAATSEAGYSLVELVMVSTLGVILMLTVLMFLEQGARSQAHTGSRVDTLTQQRVGFAGLTGELRQAETLFMVPSNATTSAVVEFDTYVRAGAAYSRLRRVRYDCSTASRCTRAESAPGSPVPEGTTAVVVIDKVISASFTPVSPPGQPAWNAAQGYPGHVQADVEVDGRRPNSNRTIPIPLKDGVALRNVPAPSA